MADRSGDLVTDLEKHSGGYQRCDCSGDALDLREWSQGPVLERQMVVRRTSAELEYGAHTGADTRGKGSGFMTEWNWLGNSSYRTIYINT